MPGVAGQIGAPLIYEGAFDEYTRTQLNNNNDWIVATSQNGSYQYTSFGTAVTLLPATAPAGTYSVSIYAVITTTITTATSWLFKLGFTDDDQAQTPTVCTSSTMTAGAAEQGTYIFRSNGTAAITYTPTSASAAAGVIAYSVILQRLL